MLTRSKRRKLAEVGYEAEAGTSASGTRSGTTAATRAAATVDTVTKTRSTAEDPGGVTGIKKLADPMEVGHHENVASSIASTSPKLSDPAEGHLEMLVDRFLDISLKNTYPVVEMECALSKPVCLPGGYLIPTKQSLLDLSVSPGKCREDGTNNVWYKLVDLDSFFLIEKFWDEPPQVKSPEYASLKALLPHLVQLEGSWVIDENTVEEVWPEMLQSQAELAYRILKGFLLYMEDTSGREAIRHLFSVLLENLSIRADHFIVSENVGGESLLCSHRRSLRAYIKQKPPIQPSSRCSRSASRGSRGSSREGMQTRSISPASSGKSMMSPPSSSESMLKPPIGKGDGSHTLILVPDVVAEVLQKFSCKLVLLTGSVKSGHTLNEQARVQLLYEMLPVVVKQKEALGLAICPNEAILIKMHVVNNTICPSFWKYKFRTHYSEPFNFDNFDRMCRDIIYHCQMLYDSVSAVDETG